MSQAPTFTAAEALYLLHALRLTSDQARATALSLLRAADAADGIEPHTTSTAHTNNGSPAFIVPDSDSDSESSSDISSAPSPSHPSTTFSSPVRSTASSVSSRQPQTRQHRRRSPSRNDPREYGAYASPPMTSSRSQPGPSRNATRGTASIPAALVPSRSTSLASSSARGTASLRPSRSASSSTGSSSASTSSASTAVAIPPPPPPYVDPQGALVVPAPTHTLVPRNAIIVPVGYNYPYPPPNTPKPLYIVTRGLRIGIFATWSEAAELVLNVPGSLHNKENSVSEARRVLESAIERGAVFLLNP